MRPVTSRFLHQRHKPPVELKRQRELVVVCSHFRSSVNLSRIVRTASCCGVTRLITCGRPKIDRKIARDGADVVNIEFHRSLAPVLKSLRADGHQLVGLEQATDSRSLCTFSFERHTALVIGNERLGLGPDVLDLLDEVVEIPVYGLPHSFNAATATGIALYEYCRQYPHG